MANLLRKDKMKALTDERDFPFVVQIAVPDGGFGCTLDAINAWHFYSRIRQRRGRHQHIGKQEFRHWCFEGIEIATAFRQRFGGEIMPATIRGCTNRRRDLASQVVAVEKSACEVPEEQPKRTYDPFRAFNESSSN